MMIISKYIIVYLYNIDVHHSFNNKKSFDNRHWSDENDKMFPHMKGRLLKAWYIFNSIHSS